MSGGGGNNERLPGEEGEMESELRLKGDEMYPKCTVCGKPIRDDQDSISMDIGMSEFPPATMHNECFDKRAKDIISGKVSVESQRGGE